MEAVVGGQPRSPSARSVTRYPGEDATKDPVQRLDDSDCCGFAPPTISDSISAATSAQQHLHQTRHSKPVDQR